MIPDLQAMTELALTAEQELARDGWDDTPPMLGIILGRREGGVDTYGVMPFPMQPADIADDVVGGLRALGGAMLQMKPGNLPRAKGLKDLAGVFFSSEGWFNNTLTPDEIAGRSLADIPSSKEVRTIYILDTAGRFVFVQRIRGENPTVQVADPADKDAWDVGGRLVDGMRKVLIALAREMPFGTADLDAIRQVGVAHSDPE